MDAILTYLAGDVTLTDIIIVAGAWLIFNAGFVAGAAWKGRRPRQNIDIENTTIRCRLTSPDDVDGLQNVTRRMGA